MRLLHARHDDERARSRQRNPAPTEADVRHWLEGNICRCTGYQNIVTSVLAGAAAMQRRQWRIAMWKRHRASAHRPRARKTSASSPARGNYVADIKRPDMALACSCARRMHHARSSASTWRPPLALPGVEAVFTGDDLAADKSAALPCGWGITGSDGTADEGAAASGAGAGQGALRRRCGRFRRRRNAGAGARGGRGDRGRLRGAAGRRRRARRHPPGRAAALRRRPRQPLLRLGFRRRKAAVAAAFAKAAHVARISLVNNRLVGNPMEPRAAIGEYDAATRPLHAVDHQPVSAYREGC